MQKSKLQFKSQKYRKLPIFGWYFCLLTVGVLFSPYSVLASTVYIDTDHAEFSVGDTILFHVRIDSEGKKINAAEGEVVLDHEAGAVSLTDINTAGSLFSLWPEKPLPSERNARISFAGGSPGGFASADAIIFNVALTLHEAGRLALSPDNIAVYLHDGKGTKDVVRVRGLVVEVLPRQPGTEAADDWGSAVANDKTAPLPFEIYAGQEASVFDGKKFLSFSATDEQSGVSYYEVVEGDLPPTRSNDTYILQEQDTPMKVTVIAYDAAGNARESVYRPTPVSPVIPYPAIITLIGIILFIILLAVLWRRIRKAKR